MHLRGSSSETFIYHLYDNFDHLLLCRETDFKEKYRKLLLEVAETVSGYFGFDRTTFGDVSKRNKKWWQHINEEKLRDRDAETTFILLRYGHTHTQLAR